MVISDRVLLAFFLVSLPCILTYVFLFKICQIRLDNFRKKRKSMTRQRENKEFEKRRYAEGLASTLASVRTFEVYKSEEDRRIMLSKLNYYRIQTYGATAFLMDKLYDEVSVSDISHINWETVNGLMEELVGYVRQL